MISTKRLHIRPIQSKDSTALFHYRSDATTNKYQSWIPQTLQEVDTFIAKNPQQFNQTNTWFQLVLIEKATQTIIGDIGIHFVEIAQVEIGYTLDKAYHGRGFATEALQGVIRYLFHNLKKHRIIASIDPRNIKSMQLLERLQFRKEAHFRKSLYFKGEWVDDVVYAILREEY